MRAALVRAPGATPQYDEFPDPATSATTEVLDLVAAGLHPVVRSLMSGRHYGSDNSWPAIPGVDAVARTADGALVYTGGTAAPYGTCAERIPVPAGWSVPLPDGADPTVVAAAVNPGLSSWLPLSRRTAERGTLGTVLVLGATGTAGLLAVQNARLLGAPAIIAGGRSEAGLERARSFGAETFSHAGDLSHDLAAALDGRTPDLVLDYAWGPIAEATFQALVGTGMSEDHTDLRYVQIGSAAGPDAMLPAHLLRSRRIELIGAGAGSHSLDQLRRELPRYLWLITDDQLSCPVEVFHLADIATAWVAADAADRRVVVVP